MLLASAVSWISSENYNELTAASLEHAKECVINVSICVYIYISYVWLPKWYSGKILSIETESSQKNEYCLTNPPKKKRT